MMHVVGNLLTVRKGSGNELEHPMCHAKDDDKDHGSQHQANRKGQLGH